MKRMATAERIAVTDQVGKRHVVLRYVEVEVEAESGAAAPTPLPEAADEYRLAGGRSVRRTGDSTFQTADGLLSFRLLEP